MTNLSTIFAKPIDRHIEGVIKADDDAGLRQEIEEYVLTNEVSKRLENFLYAYNNYEGANGVWISGFFGSGKSHLLKMLAMLLENRQVNSINTLDEFLDKCGDNEILRGDIKRAVAIPSRSILFNIDQKADVISKKQIDALLAVFAKVFDEMCGYYGKQGHIAKFERDLDSRDQYDAFKTAYQEVAGQGWEFGREMALLEGPNIAAAYAQATGEPQSEAVGILDKYRAQYKLSIEDFAEQVNDYIERQEPNFRLNFFVDEVGQYIADNVKLMTNLQTVAESLATKCNGRSWIIVTAQEDMSDIVGEMGKQQSNDFSKIQARFKNRMKLTSADVAEVIRKRLLLKNEKGIQKLSGVYAQQQNNFKTLFDFADGAQTYRNFRDRDHFIHSYPFVPYQFTLFQSAIQSLSQHNAFEGKHSSVGERSMLGVFQQVSVQIADSPIGDLATFDRMFSGISATLKTDIQRPITVATKHLRSPFAIQVLKALMLVKYVKEFKATVRNLSVLMLPHFDADLPALKRKLEGALNLLEQQTYIQRSGDIYEYLTDEEKDVEEEIKQTEIDSSVITDELHKLIFDYVLRDRKIRYDENDQDYPFSRKLDDRVIGREYELAIHVVSPFHENSGNDKILRAHAMGRSELLVILPPSDRLMRDLTLYKQTDKYVLQNISNTQKESVRRILSDKQLQNQERSAALRQMVAEQLLEATLVVSGQDLEISSTDAKTRLVKGFHDLLLRTYPNLRMLRGILYREEDIGKYLRPEMSQLSDDAATFSEAEQEMLNFVNINQRNGLRTTLASLVQKFERKPYGWYLAAIQCILAKLCARDKIELRQDANALEDTALERAIRNTHGFNNVILEPYPDIPQSMIRGLHDFYADFFDGPPMAIEAKALGRVTADAFREEQQKLQHFRQQAINYPFLTALDGPIALLNDLIGKPYNFYLTELRRFEDDLLDAKEETIIPIREFMTGAKKQIFDDARRLLRDQAPNFSYIDREDDHDLRRILDDRHCYQGNRMQQAKSLLDKLNTEIAARVQQEKVAILNKADERWQRLIGMAEFGDLTGDQQAQLARPFEQLKAEINRPDLIAVIRDTLNRFDETRYPHILRQMTTWANPPEPTPDPGPGGKPFAEPKPTYEIISHRSLPVPFTRALLTSESDVEAYLTALKQTLLQAIEEGKHIQI